MRPMIRLQRAAAARDRSVRTGLEPPGLGEGVLLHVADDEVVEDTDVDERERVSEALRSRKRPTGMRKLNSTARTPGFHHRPLEF